MPPAPTTTPPAAARRGGGGLVAWLRTREGKITAGAGAAVLVVIVALLRGGRGGESAPFTAESLQGGPDGTLQDRLDQLGLRGGTIEELIGSTSDLTAGVVDLTERIDELGQGPSTPPTTTPPKTTVGKISRLIFASNTQDISVRWHPVTGAAKYIVQWIRGNPSAPGRQEVIKTQTVSAGGQLYARFGGGLQSRKPYRVRIIPVASSGAKGPSTTDVYRTK